jgi:pimeloyl-ACP methyl ester carboxylesterase
MVDRTVAALTELPRSVVLVGHSLAGMVISAAAEKAPDRIKTLVFLTALFPHHEFNRIAFGPCQPGSV